jgi:hypothetical protein
MAAASESRKRWRACVIATGAAPSRRNESGVIKMVRQQSGGIVSALANIGSKGVMLAVIWRQTENKRGETQKTRNC